MAKRELSKGQIALREARNLMEKAQGDVNEADAKLMTARAVYTAYAQAFYTLERSLAREPRKKAVKTVAPEKAMSA